LDYNPQNKNLESDFDLLNGVNLKNGYQAAWKSYND
jgi:hypothetical protein